MFYIFDAAPTASEPETDASTAAGNTAEATTVDPDDRSKTNLQAIPFYSYF